MHKFALAHSRIWSWQNRTTYSLKSVAYAIVIYTSYKEFVDHSKILGSTHQQDEPIFRHHQYSRFGQFRWIKLKAIVNHCKDRYAEVIQPYLTIQLPIRIDGSHIRAHCPGLLAPTTNRIGV